MYLLTCRSDFGLTYCSSGDLLQYINDAGHFEPETVRFYAAELVEALEHLHTRRIVHRDLKVTDTFVTLRQHVLDLLVAGEHSAQR